MRAPSTSPISSSADRVPSDCFATTAPSLTTRASPARSELPLRASGGPVRSSIFDSSTESPPARPREPIPLAIRNQIFHREGKRPAPRFSTAQRGVSSPRVPNFHRRRPQLPFRARSIPRSRIVSRIDPPYSSTRICGNFAILSACIVFLNCACQIRGTAQIAAKISFNDGAADLGLLPISDF
jgi:hypothetical protein